MASNPTTNTDPAADAATSNGSGGGGAANGVQVAFRLSKVNYKTLKFVIMDRPTNDNLSSYLLNLKRAVSEAEGAPRYIFSGLQVFKQ
jgi:hypothetical protein